MNQPAIYRVKHLDLSFEPWVWPFARERRAEILDYFGRQRALKPRLFNGQVLMMREPRVEGDTLSGCYFQTDFASYMMWRELGFPDEAISSGFGLGALRGSDGVYLMGEMSAHTANAGRIYFPSGTPDPSDLNGDRVDIAASIAREVFEETGLSEADYHAGSEFCCVFSRPAVAIFRVLNLKAPAATCRERILANMAREAYPEFSAIHLVRDARDILPSMPRYVSAFMHHVTKAAE